MVNLIVLLIAMVVVLAVLSIVFFVIFLKLSGIADALNELGTMIGEMWDDLE